MLKSAISAKGEIRTTNYKFVEWRFTIHNFISFFNLIKINVSANIILDVTFTFLSRYPHVLYSNLIINNVRNMNKRPNKKGSVFLQGFIFYWSQNSIKISLIKCKKKIAVQINLLKICCIYIFFLGGGMGDIRTVYLIRYSRIMTKTAIRYFLTICVCIFKTYKWMGEGK